MSAVLDVLFPPACVACDAVLRGREPFCEECEHLLLETGPIHCARCGEPGDFPRQLCPRCVKHRPAFARAFGPYEHDGAIAKAIHRFKYEDRPELSGPLAQLLVRESRAFLETAPKHVVPLPLHAARYRSRRYDQATLLAADLCREDRRFMLCDQVLTRVRATQRQVGLSDEQRVRNVEGAFEARQSPAEVLLVDDVLTTGATADAAALALKRAGAKRIEVLTLARARRLLAF
jgi:ComF family protein